MNMWKTQTGYNHWVLLTYLFTFQPFLIIHKNKIIKIKPNKTHLYRVQGYIHCIHITVSLGGNGFVCVCACVDIWSDWHHIFSSLCVLRSIVITQVCYAVVRPTQGQDELLPCCPSLAWAHNLKSFKHKTVPHSDRVCSSVDTLHGCNAFRRTIQPDAKQLAINK